MTKHKNYLALNADYSILQINTVPFQAEALVDSQSTEPPQEICSLCICSLEMFIHNGAFCSCEGNNVHALIYSCFSADGQSDEARHGKAFEGLLKRYFGK